MLYLAKWAIFNNSPWRRNKKAAGCFSEPRSSVSPAKRRKVVQSEHGSTEFPPWRPRPPFIPMKSFVEPDVSGDVLLSLPISLPVHEVEFSTM